ncbi:MAG: hypothetical protein QXR53_04215 [Candidatus Norongarragalinales archaeon]
MVWTELADVLDAAQNAVLISFGRVFDFIFGFHWIAAGDSLAWTAAGVLVIALLFL